MGTRPISDERLNEMARLIQSHWARFVPLSIRYRAARAADEIVAEWFERVSEAAECQSEAETT